MCSKEAFLSAQSFEVTLARLYTDPTFRNQFMTDPKSTLVNCNLTAEEQDDLMAIDRAGLLMASRSFLHKRKKRFFHGGKAVPFIARITSFVRGIR